METVSDESPEGAAVETAPEEASHEELPAKQVYLRTVYPLNPGIPHFVDVPGGW